MPLEILHRAAPCRNVPVTFTLDGMSEALCSIKQLAHEIRVLTAGGREPDDRELGELQRRLQGARGLVAPHFIWHWLADADIRAKDPEYRRVQLEQLEAALNQMESSHAA